MIFNINIVFMNGSFAVRLGKIYILVPAVDQGNYVIILC